MASLGVAAPVAHPVVLTDDQIIELAAVMLDRVTNRLDTAINYAAYAAGAAACPLTPIRLSSVGEHAPAVMTNATRTVRNLLTADHWQEARLLDLLFEAITGTDRKVILIEDHDTHVGGVTWRVLSMHAVGAGRTASLDWRRVRHDAEDYDDRVITAVSGLLDELERRTGPVLTEPPPVIALAPRLGGWRDVRRIVGGRAAEYAMVVEPGYAQDTVVPELYAQRRHGAPVASFFGMWPLHEPPPPLPLRRDGTRFGEYAVPFTDGEERRYAVVRPRRPNGLLQGHRTEQRAAEIGAMVGQLHPVSMTRTLRIDSFQQANDVAWRRHALLLSAGHSVLAGNLTPSSRSVQRVSDALELS